MSEYRIFRVIRQEKQYFDIEYVQDLVRCAECKHSDWYKDIKGEWRCYCTEHGSGGHKADDFCSYGERKESK